MERDLPGADDDEFMILFVGYIWIEAARNRMLGTFNLGCGGASTIPTFPFPRFDETDEGAVNASSMTRMQRRRCDGWVARVRGWICEAIKMVGKEK